MANQGLYYYTKDEQDAKFPKMINMNGEFQTTAYYRSVIALCEVSTAASTALDSWTSGRFVLHRDNGLAGITEININMENQYSSAYYTNVSYYSNAPLLSASANIDTDYGFRPCTFKYNNKYYGGIEICIAAAQLNIIRFEGVGNFNIFGLDYYSMAHGSTAHQILNSEVYNSLDYSKWTKAKGTWYS